MEASSLPTVRRYYCSPIRVDCLDVVDPKVAAPMKIANIPRHAERTFAALCATVGATCNESLEDERGWDFLVQFPQRQSPHLPLDMQPPADKCFVQVKTNSGEFEGVRLKLSNAFEFASSDAPCFVVLFSYTECKQTELVRILHFWKPEIARTLKRIRELDAEGRSDLNRMMLEFSTSTMIEVSCQQLVPTIESIIRKSGARYGDVKRELSQKVGFDEVTMTVDVTFGPGVTIEDIVDVQIGLKDSLEISKVSGRSIRFGIPAAHPHITQEGGKLSMRSHAKECIAWISSGAVGREVSLPSSLYVPLVPNLPKALWRFRIANEFLQLTSRFSDASGSFTVAWDGSDRRTLAQLGIMLDLIYMLCSGQVEFRALLDPKLPPLHGKAKLEPVELSASDHKVDAFIKFVLSQTKPHEVPSSLRISLDELYDREESIEEHNIYINPAPVNATAEVTWKGTPYVGPGKGLLAPHVELPHHVIYTIVQRDMQIGASADGKTAFTLGAVNYTRVRILPGSVATTFHLIERELGTLRSDSPDMYTLLLPPSVSTRAEPPSNTGRRS